MFGSETKINPKDNDEIDEEEKEERDSQLKNISQDFLENCGLHGINKIRSSERNTSRRSVYTTQLLN